ncbi:MAG: tyrosine-type recombinase/integrase [Anaerolineae bacterium]|nr:tyrosine-type recombinase/integrase [Anaerolineae bacterium]
MYTWKLDMLLSEAVAEFLDYHRVLEHSPSTIHTYQKCLRYFLHYAGDRPLAHFAARDFDLYHAMLMERVEANAIRLATVRKRLKAVKSLFGFCVTRHYLPENPASHFRPRPVEVDPTEKTIPAADLQKVLDWCWRKPRSAERDTFIVVALVEFGPRRAEIAGLRLDNIDRHEAMIRITRKGGKEQRIPVSSAFFGALDRWLEVRPECDHDYVLCALGSGREYVPLKPEALGQAFRRMTARVCDKSWGPHSVRHFWITWQLNQVGTPLKVVADIAGHKSLRTMAAYAAPDLHAQRKAIARQPFDLAAPAVPAEAGADEALYITVDLDTWTVW